MTKQRQIAARWPPEGETEEDSVLAPKPAAATVQERPNVRLETLLGFSESLDPRENMSEP